MTPPDKESLQTVARALSDPTRASIFWHIFDADEPVFVAELTKLLGFHHNAIRQHISKLVHSGLVVEEVERRDRPGRPRLQYIAPDDALSAFGDASRNYQRLSRLLLEIAQSGEDAYEVGVSSARADRGEESPTADLAALLPALSAGGFAPKLENDTIVLESCAFADVASEGPSVVCELHRGLIDGALGVEADLVAKDPQEASCEIRLVD